MSQTLGMRKRVAATLRSVNSLKSGMSCSIAVSLGEKDAAIVIAAGNESLKHDAFGIALARLNEMYRFPIKNGKVYHDSPFNGFQKLRDEEMGSPLVSFTAFFTDLGTSPELARKLYIRANTTLKAEVGHTTWEMDYGKDDSRMVKAFVVARAARILEEMKVISSEECVEYIDMVDQF